MELGLRILDALYGSDKMQHERFRDANVIKSAILSNAAPVDLCFALTEVLENRYTLDQSTAPSIQLLEMAFNLLQTTLHSLMQSTDIISSEDVVNGIFAQLEMNYGMWFMQHDEECLCKGFIDMIQSIDWRTCMLWSDFQFTLQKRHDPTKAKLSIPRSLQPMVDTLDGTCRLYGTMSHAHQTCWDVLFDTCKLSPLFIEKLFSVGWSIFYQISLELIVLLRPSMCGNTIWRLSTNTRWKIRSWHTIFTKAFSPAYRSASASSTNNC